MIEARNEPGPSIFPEKSGDKTEDPPVPPSSHGSAIDTKAFTHAIGILWVEQEMSSRNQYDHQTEVNLGSEETNRRRSVAFAATLARATVAKTEQFAMDARPPGAAIVMGRVKSSAAKATALAPADLGKIFIANCQ